MPQPTPPKPRVPPTPPAGPRPVPGSVFAESQSGRIRRLLEQPQPQQPPVSEMLRQALSAPAAPATWQFPGPRRPEKSPPAPPAQTGIIPYLNTLDRQEKTPFKPLDIGGLPNLEAFRNLPRQASSSSSGAVVNTPTSLPQPGQTSAAVTAPASAPPVPASADPVKKDLTGLEAPPVRPAAAQAAPEAAPAPTARPPLAAGTPPAPAPATATASVPVGSKLLEIDPGQSVDGQPARNPGEKAQTLTEPDLTTNPTHPAPQPSVTPEIKPAEPKTADQNPDPVSSAKTAFESYIAALEADPVTRRFGQELRQMEAEDSQKLDSIRSFVPAEQQEPQIHQLRVESMVRRIDLQKRLHAAQQMEEQTMRRSAAVLHSKGKKAYDLRFEQDSRVPKTTLPLKEIANFATYGLAGQLMGDNSPSWWERKSIQQHGSDEEKRQMMEQDSRREEEAMALREAVIRKGGMDPADPNHKRLLEDAAKMDWTSGGMAVGESILTGETAAGIESFVKDAFDGATTGNTGRAKVENSRLLSDGTIIVNPLLIQSDEGYARAVEESGATPEAKARALAHLPDLQRAHAAALLPALKQLPDIFPGQQFPDYVKERSRKDPAFAALAEDAQAETYLKEQLSRGYMTRLADKVGSSLWLGALDVATQAVGITGMVTGQVPGVGEYFSQGAADLASLGALWDETTNARTGTGMVGNVVGGVARMAPSLAVMYATGGLTAGPVAAGTMTPRMASSLIFAVAGAQTAGSQYAQIYGTLREEGKGHYEAWMPAAGSAFASGMTTAGLTALGGRTGAEALLPQARQQVSQSLRSYWGQALRSVPKNALKEVPEEFFDELASTCLQAVATGKDPQEAMREFLLNSPDFIGSVLILGGAGGTVDAHRQTRPSQPLQPAPSSPLPQVPASPLLPLPPATPPQASASTPNPYQPDLDAHQEAPQQTATPPSQTPTAPPEAVQELPSSAPGTLAPPATSAATTALPATTQTRSSAHPAKTTPTPPIWQGRARRGESAAILGRNPDGTFQVSLNGVEKTFTEPNLAGMLNMRKGPLYEMLGQATQQQLAQPRTNTTPPIWQGRGLNGDPVSVLSRNPDGTFQTLIHGQEKTRTERDIAQMLNLRKGPLYEMLGQATRGRLQLSGMEASNIQKPPSGPLESAGQREVGSVYANIPLPDGRPSIQEWVDPKDVTYWDQRLADARVRDPVDYTEVLSNSDADLGPLNRLQVHRAMQSFLNLIPGDIVRAIGPFDLYAYKTIIDEKGKPVNASGQWIPGNSGQVKDSRYEHGPHIRLTHDLATSEYQLRSTLWHEMTHWLWDNADKHPRLKKWRSDLEQHFAERTAGEDLLWDSEGGYYYWKDGWIENYSGRHYPGRTPGVELPTTYMQLLSGGGLGVAMWTHNKSITSTFELVMSILGDTK